MDNPTQTTKLQWALARDLTKRAVEELKHPPVGVKIPSFPKLTHFLGGFRPHELTLFCAPTGTGKTAFIASLAAQIVNQDIPVFAAPVETGDLDFLKRIFSVASGVELNHGDPIPPETITQALQKGAFNIVQAPLLIANYDNRVDIDELIGVLKIMSGKGVKVSLLDNLNFFLKVSTAENERMVLDEAVHKIVMFVKEYPMHVFLICHPRKTDNGRVMSEFDIKGSSTAVQEAANIILFNRPKDEDLLPGLRGGKRKTHRELVFKKIRKRGMYVDHPVWFEYVSGGYIECN